MQPDVLTLLYPYSRFSQMSTIYFQGRKIYIFCRKVLHRVVGGEVGAGEVQNTEKTSEKISFFIIIFFLLVGG